MKKWTVISLVLLHIISSIMLLSSLTHYYNNGVSNPAKKNPASRGDDLSLESANYLKWMAACASARIYNASVAADEEGGRELQELKRTTVPAESTGACNLFSGRWVPDNESYPLYRDVDCPYLSRQEHERTRCEANGRPDLMYQQWRWQPHACNVRRWNATRMLEKLRGKRMVYVGDSVNRGQWISMVCMLQSVIPEQRRSMTPFNRLTIFKAEDYNATVEFHWSPFLTESTENNPILHGGIYNISVIRLDTIVQYAARYWKDADILVFDSFHWWTSTVRLHLLWTEEEERWTCDEAEGLRAMKLALNKWADWIDSYVDAEKQRVFFVTVSPVHNSWARDCTGVKAPVGIENYKFAPKERPAMSIVDGVLRRLSSKVSILNITQLSMYRKDGHISFSSAPEEDRIGYHDCVHWCLPGVPDVWNQLLFHLL